MHTLFDEVPAAAREAAAGAISKARAPSFEEFWAAWPKREAKKDARRAWERLPAASKVSAMAALPAHVDRWRREGRVRNHIPHPATWLNGERWDDELGEVFPQRSTGQPARQAGLPWWSSHTLMEQKGREVGVGRARPGEDTMQYRARIQEAIEAQQRYGPTPTQ